MRSFVLFLATSSVTLECHGLDPALWARLGWHPWIQGSSKGGPNLPVIFFNLIHNYRLSVYSFPSSLQCMCATCRKNSLSNLCGHPVHNMCMDKIQQATCNTADSISAANTVQKTDVICKVI
jgi:hypothetical protein